MDNYTHHNLYINIQYIDLILILFCIRILLMRLSAISLNKLFKSVWPSLITLLIQIFKKGKGPKPSALLLAALKVVELLHAMKL